MIDKPKLKNVSKALELYPYTENGFFWSEFLTNNKMTKSNFIYIMNFFISGAYRFQNKKFNIWRLLYQEKLLKTLWFNHKSSTAKYKTSFEFIHKINFACNNYFKNNNDDISLYNFYQSFIYTFYTKKRFIKVYLAKPNSILFKLISENFGDNEYLKKD